MIRAVTAGDAEALLRLCNASLRWDVLAPALLHEKVFEDPGVSLVWDQDGLRGFVHRVGRSIKLLCVDPAWQGRGIGSELLQAAENALPWEALRVCESVPNYLVPGLDVRYTNAILFFEKHGYRRFGETYNLCCELTQPFSERPAPAGVDIREATPADKTGALLQFIRAHFAAWEAEMKAGKVFVAVRGGEVLGFAAYDANNRGTGWFGPMGTSPAHRGLGIGAVLLHRCLADLRAQGLARCTIPWVGPYGFYARECGAYIERVFWRYEKSCSLPSS